MKKLIMALIALHFLVGSITVHANNTFPIDNSLGAQYLTEYRLYHNAYDSARIATQGTGIRLPEFITQKRSIREVSIRDLELLRNQQSMLGKLELEVRTQRHQEALKRNEAAGREQMKGSGKNWSRNGLSAGSMARGLGALTVIAAAFGHSSEIQAEPVETNPNRHKPSQVSRYSSTNPGWLPGRNNQNQQESKAAVSRQGTQ